jgi:hypothetical protein
VPSQKSLGGAVGATLGNAPYQLNSPAILVYFPASVAFCWSGAIEVLLNKHFIENFGSETPSFYDGFPVKY